MTTAEKRAAAMQCLSLLRLRVIYGPAREELLDALTDYTAALCAARIRAAADRVEGPAKSALIAAAEELEK